MIWNCFTFVFISFNSSLDLLVFFCMTTQSSIMNINICQSNLALDGIAANWGFRSPNLPISWGLWGPSNTMLLGNTQVSLPNGISFCPTAFAGCTGVTDDIHTYIQGLYRRTDHTMVTCVEQAKLLSVMSPNYSNARKHQINIYKLNSSLSQSR